MIQQLPKPPLLTSMLIALTILRGSFQHGVGRHNGRICRTNPTGPYHRREPKEKWRLLDRAKTKPIEDGVVRTL